MTQVRLVNMFATNDFQDVSSDIRKRLQTFNLMQHQQNDEVFRETKWREIRPSHTQPPSFLSGLQEHWKRFICLAVEDDNLYRLFYDNFAK